MKASDYIAGCLADNGVRVVFGYQGGNIAHIIDSIGNREDMEFVSTYNEQGASFSACGYALESEGLGVAISSSGPGAINLISGIANAYYDSIPCLFITGNVSLPTMKKSNDVRQNAFQENDIVSMVGKITKYAVTVLDEHDLRFHLDKALYLAASGRPGPVLLDIPHNIQKADLDFMNETGFEAPAEEKSDFSGIKDLKEKMTASVRPLVVVGGGAANSKSRQMIGKLLEKWNVPVVSTLRGLAVVAHDCDNYAGFGGAYGNRWANYAIKHADTILVLGARLDERFLNVSDKSLFEKKNVFHVDIDEIELGRILPYEFQIKADINDFLEKLITSIDTPLSFKRWSGTIKRWKERYPSEADGWNINSIVKTISENAPENTVFSLDIGISQMSTAQSIVIGSAQKCITSAGHGAMGCAVPLAIGVAYANRDKIVDCFVGDGALHMNIQELLMLSRDSLPVHIILNNNQCLGMIRDYQTKVFESRFTATVRELHGIDYKKIAEAYGLKYIKVEEKDGLEPAKEMLRSWEPCFIELVFPEDSDTCPKLGADMFEQFPRLSQKEKDRMVQEALECGIN